jgi:pyruvate formate lyase activating enzyme
MIFDIQRASTVDGPGVRTTVFFKGCNLNCAWCHNPESQSPKPQMLYFRNRCKGCGKCKTVCENGQIACTLCGKCALYCPYDARRICGKEYDVDEVMREIVKDVAFYQNSDGGATFSGGECMLQIDFLEGVLKECKKNGIHTAVDTAGCVPWAYFERILPYVDLFLYDVKCADDALHCKMTGVSNRLILENLRLLCDRADVLVRIPVIPTVNANDEEMGRLAALLAPLKTVGVELLPYHRLGEGKNEALGRDGAVFDVPRAEEMKRFGGWFQKRISR